jgi:hypothetical protein
MPTERSLPTLFFSPLLLSSPFYFSVLSSSLLLLRYSSLGNVALNMPQQETTIEQYQSSCILPSLSFPHVRFLDDYKQTNMASIHTNTSTHWQLRCESMYTSSEMKCRHHFTINASCQTLRESASLNSVRYKVPSKKNSQFIWFNNLWSVRNVKFSL